MQYHNVLFNFTGRKYVQLTLPVKTKKHLSSFFWILLLTTFIKKQFKKSFNKIWRNSSHIRYCYQREEGEVARNGLIFDLMQLGQYCTKFVSISLNGNWNVVVKRSGTITSRENRKADRQAAKWPKTPHSKKATLKNPLQKSRFKKIERKHDIFLRSRCLHNFQWIAFKLTKPNSIKCISLEVCLKVYSTII